MLTDNLGQPILFLERPLALIVQWHHSEPRSQGIGKRPVLRTRFLLFSFLESERRRTSCRKRINCSSFSSRARAIWLVRSSASWRARTCSRSSRWLWLVLKENVLKSTRILGLGWGKRRWARSKNSSRHKKNQRETCRRRAGAARPAERRGPSARRRGAPGPRRCAGSAPWRRRDRPGIRPPRPVPPPCRRRYRFHHR